MVSSTQQYSRIRRRKQTTNGKRNKRELRAAGTPVFPVHPEGYNASAADARPVEAPKPVAVKRAAKPAGAKPAGAKPAGAKPAAASAK